MKNEITAVLFNARRDGDRITGNCYCDRSARFTDGEIITTSAVIDTIEIPGVMTGALVVTKNSIYKIANWIK